LFLKHWFDVFSNPNLLPALDALRPDRIVLYGVALDVCDKYAVEGLLRERPAISLTVVTDAVRAIDPAAGAALLEDWRGRGVRLATAAEILAA
jgi:nicotinamidase-related amidase